MMEQMTALQGQTVQTTGANPAALAVGFAWPVGKTKIELDRYFQMHRRWVCPRAIKHIQLAQRCAALSNTQIIGQQAGIRGVIQ